MNKCNQSKDQPELLFECSKKSAKKILFPTSERNRYPLNVFIQKILQWTVEWSEEYKSGAKMFSTVPTIDLPLWTAAYKWVKLDKLIKQSVDKNSFISYKFAAGEVKTIKDWNILSKWKTFQ